MNSSPALACSEHITAAARRTHNKVVALYGLQRWGVIRQPYVSLLRAAQNTGPQPSGIMETARKLKRMAVSEDLDEAPEFIIAAAVEIAEEGGIS